METYLSDFETTLTANSESYTLCYRLYTKCQTIVFAETAVDLSQPDVLRVSIAETKISKNARIAPMIVGLGVVLGSVGSPIAFQAAEKVIHVQVRQPRHQAFMEIIDTDDDSGNPQELTPEQIKKSNRRDSFLSKILARVPSNSPTVEELNRGNAFSFNNFVQKTRKKSKKLARKTPSNESFKVLPQSSGDLTSRESRAKSFDRNTIPDDSDNHQLLNPHYFHSEIQFIMALVDISERLVSSPKPSRQSSLLAELTLLNHNLPANVCLPFWCPAEYNEQKHHQIARIALTDCVVLNSAERVPFLICVEVIENGRHMGSSNFLSPHTQKRDSESRRNSTVYFNGVVSRRESYMERRKSAEVQSRLERADTGLSYMSQDYEAEEFREKMRTAAVMLAQLYQQQQRGVESAAIKSYSRFRSISATAASYIYPKSATAASYIYPKSATGDKPSSLPPSPSAADRVQQKLKSEFEEIRAKVIKEMALSEAARLEALQKRLPDDIDTTVGVLEKLAPEEEEDLHHGTFHQSSDDPSASVFFESWAMKKERIRQSSPYGQNDKWDLFAVIVKSGADLRQEQLALQTIKEIQSCWESLSIPLWVYPFRMLITSADSGLVEVIPDSVSIHSIKKAGYMKRLNTPGIVYSLYDHFIHTFGPAGSERFQTAQENFIRSLAGYSLICYLLQIKDRFVNLI